MSDRSLEWARVADDWFVDGSLRGIYVHETTFDDWRRALSAFALKNWPTEYHEDGAEVDQRDWRSHDTDAMT